MVFKDSAFRRMTKNRRKLVSKTVSRIESVLGRLWAGFGDRFGEDFGGLGRSWGSKMEAGRGKKSNKKRKAKKEAIKRKKGGQKEAKMKK